MKKLFRRRGSKTSYLCAGAALLVTSLGRMSSWNWEYLKTPGRVFYGIELAVGILMILWGLLRDRLCPADKGRGSGNGFEERVKKLKELRESGMISREEYEDRVRKLRGD